VKWTCKVPNFCQGQVTREGLFARSPFTFVPSLVARILIIPSTFPAPDRRSVFVRVCANRCLCIVRGERLPRFWSTLAWTAAELEKKKTNKFHPLVAKSCLFVSKTEWIFPSCSRIHHLIRAQEKSRPLTAVMVLLPTACRYPRRHLPRLTPNGYLVVGGLHAGAPSFGRAPE
jgi:hypothetical protein